MNRDIHKKGLLLLAIIVVALITFFGYLIDSKKDNEVIPNNTVPDSDIVEDSNSSNVEIVEETANIIVDISGAIKNPGIYELIEGSRVNDAIEAAGGLTEEVNNEYLAKYINKARILNDEEKIYIPKLEDDVSIIETNNGSNNSNESQIKGKININTASKEELVTLKGIGEAFAQRIIDYRKTNKFKTIEDIKNVKGIGDKTFEGIKDYITVD